MKGFSLCEQIQADVHVRTGVGRKGEDNILTSDPNSKMQFWEKRKGGRTHRQ